MFLLVFWLFGIGDLFCMLVGWLCLKFWFSVMYMVIGKFLCYLVMIVVLMIFFDGFWYGIFGWIKSVMM